MAKSLSTKTAPFMDWTLNSAGSPEAAPGSPEWAVSVRLHIQSFLKDSKSSAELLSSYYQAMDQYQGWRHLFDPEGHQFTSFKAFCCARQPWGLGYPPEIIERVISEGWTPQELAQNPKSIGDPVTVPASYTVVAKEDIPPTADIVRRKTPKVNGLNGSKYGNDAEYLTARIARDRPDIHERMKAGEYKSVRAAAKDAGIIREQTSIEKAQKLWQKMTAKERAAFQKWIKENAA